jgi:hypothetical protein
MSVLLEMPAEELLERVEQAAAGGDKRAASLLRTLVEQLEADGELGVILRLACSPHVGGCN